MLKKLLLIGVLSGSALLTFPSYARGPDYPPPVCALNCKWVGGADGWVCEGVLMDCVEP